MKDNDRTTDAPHASFQDRILKALNTPSRVEQMYLGTANRNKVAKARRRNKAARISRRRNRGQR